MSQQRFPCHDRDGHDKRSRLRWSLVKAKRSHVATKICSVATRFHSVMSGQSILSRQGILCHDREWPRLKDLGCDRVNSVATE